MRKLTMILALGLVTAACSGGASDTGADTTATTSGDATTTTSTTTSTTVRADTTTSSSSAPGGGTDNESCLVGTWVLDGDLFLEAIVEAMEEEEDLEGATFSHVDGEYVAIIQGDGTFIDRRTDWTIGVTSDFGDMAFVINDEQTGTWSADNGTITVSVSSDTPSEPEIYLDGVKFEFPLGVVPMSPPDVEWVSAAYVCDGNTLTMTSEGFDSVWNRS